MVLAMAWPASMSASKMIWITNAIATPMRICTAASSIMCTPSGSTATVGPAIGASRKPSRIARITLMRAGTTAAPNTGATRNRPIARRNGHITLCTKATRSPLLSVITRLPQHRRDVLEQLARVADQRLQHPGACDEDRRDEHGEPGDEAQRHLVDLDRGLDHDDDETHDQRGDEQRCGEERRDGER